MLVFFGHLLIVIRSGFSLTGIYFADAVLAKYYEILYPSCSALAYIYCIYSIRSVGLQQMKKTAK